MANPDPRPIFTEHARPRIRSFLVKALIVFFVLLVVMWAASHLITSTPH